ncbi:MAG TPA: IS481 family transposase [Acidimicrobiales bacterium]|nr:IS481 family transposase [Acidimicrobiales bacterium]
MLVELNVVEQRYAAVLEVLNDGVSVTEAAARAGVTRQTVQRWLRRYASDGLAGLVDRSSVPASCPHQMAPAVEARIVALRLEHPGWGPRTLGHQLGREGFDPVPGRSSIYRCLIRHQLIEVEPRRRKKADYKRWERSRAMELWQMDVVGGVQLADGWKASIVSGIDDHSRFVVSAHVVRRATAKPTCDALAKAMRAHGVPAEILTDNGKVFTGRFGPGKGEVLFDRICRENGIRHLLTAPRSPTTTGKIERWHKTLRREFLDGKVFVDLDDAQAQLDAWVEHYNHDRPHQGIGMVAPWERFRLADPDAFVDDAEPGAPAPTATRRVGSTGKISFAGTLYGVGVWLSGEAVEVAVEDGVVSISHRGVLVQTHAQRHRPDKELAALTRKSKARVARPRQPTVGQSVTRKVEVSGTISFAGHAYRVGKAHARRQVQVAIVGEVVEISAGGQVLKTHPIRHDRSREHGAFANAGGRPSRINAA